MPQRSVAYHVSFEKDDNLRGYDAAEGSSGSETEDLMERKLSERWTDSKGKLHIRARKPALYDSSSEEDNSQDNAASWSSRSSPAMKAVQHKGAEERPDRKHEQKKRSSRPTARPRRTLTVRPEEEFATDSPSKGATDDAWEKQGLSTVVHISKRETEHVTMKYNGMQERSSSERYENETNRNSVASGNEGNGDQESGVSDHMSIESLADLVTRQWRRINDLESTNETLISMLKEVTQVQTAQQSKIERLEARLFGLSEAKEFEWRGTVAAAAKQQAGRPNGVQHKEPWVSPRLSGRSQDERTQLEGGGSYTPKMQSGLRTVRRATIATQVDDDEREKKLQKRFFAIDSQLQSLSKGLDQASKRISQVETWRTHIDDIAAATKGIEKRTAHVEDVTATLPSSIATIERDHARFKEESKEGLHHISAAVDKVETFSKRFSLVEDDLRTLRKGILKERNERIAQYKQIDFRGRFCPICKRVLSKETSSQEECDHSEAACSSVSAWETRGLQLSTDDLKFASKQYQDQLIQFRRLGGMVVMLCMLHLLREKNSRTEGRLNVSRSGQTSRLSTNAEMLGSKPKIMRASSVSRAKSKSESPAKTETPQQVSRTRVDPAASGGEETSATSKAREGLRRARRSTSPDLTTETPALRTGGPPASSDVAREDDKSLLEILERSPKEAVLLERSADMTLEFEPSKGAVPDYAVSRRSSLGSAMTGNDESKESYMRMHRRRRSVSSSASTPYEIALKEVGRERRLSRSTTPQPRPSSRGVSPRRQGRDYDDPARQSTARRVVEKIGGSAAGGSSRSTLQDGGILSEKDVIAGRKGKRASLAVPTLDPASLKRTFDRRAYALTE